jgi:transcriptional regulator with XRE-family HTH domain
MAKQEKQGRNSPLEAYLESRGLTKSDLSKLSGIPPQTIGYWCDGQEPKFGTAVKAAAALGVSLKFFARLLELKDCPIDDVPDDVAEPGTYAHFRDYIDKAIEEYECEHRL